MVGGGGGDGGGSGDGGTGVVCMVPPLTRTLEMSWLPACERNPHPRPKICFLETHCKTYLHLFTFLKISAPKWGKPELINLISSMPITNTSCCNLFNVPVE